MEWILLERFLCRHLGPIARQLDGIELLLLFQSQQHIWMKNDALAVGRIEASSSEPCLSLIRWRRPDLCRRCERLGLLGCGDKSWALLLLLSGAAFGHPAHCSGVSLQPLRSMALTTSGR